MAVPTNLYQKASLKGNREDLLDKIYNTSPTETPVLSAIGRVSATSDYHEWQTDSLAAPNAANKMIDGDDASAAAITPTNRVGNYLQIFNGTVGVSRRANQVKKAGRGSELAYLTAKKMLEIKRDIEAMILGNQAAVAATTSVAGVSGGLGVQSYVNTSHGGTGATASWTSGAPTTAITAGTNRTFTEALLKTVCQSIFTNSGNFVEMAVMSPSHKALFSAFTGIASSRSDVKGKNQATIVGAADVYISDFGAISIVPHYAMVGATDVFLLNSDYMEMAYLDGFKQTPLAKTGDSEKVLITADCALAVRAPSAVGKISNLTA